MQAASGRSEFIFTTGQDARAKFVEALAAQLTRFSTATATASLTAAAVPKPLVTPAAAPAASERR